MANPKGNTHSIHLVSNPPKPNLDPTDIAASVLKTVRDCSKALRDCADYQQWAVGQMSGQLHDLELDVLRAMARKGRAR